MEKEIPKNLTVIDLEPYVKDTQQKAAVARQIREVCKESGFFFIKNHGVPVELQQSLMKNSETFFKLPMEAKRAIHMDRGGKAWRGYFQLGEQFTSGKIDLKEGLYLGRELGSDHPKVSRGVPLYGPNLFPEELPEIKRDILEWLSQMDRLGDTLLQAIADSLGLDSSYFREKMCRDHLGLMRIFHYPRDDNQDPEIWSVGEHTDYGLLTILMVSDKGLQVRYRRTDEWISVDPIPDTFVVNIGDIMERMTNGLYQSTPHRVRNTQGRSRYSVPYFYDADWDAPILELSIDVSQEEKLMQNRTHNIERWDKANLRNISGKYGEYLIGKISKVFPDLAKDHL